MFVPPEGIPSTPGSYSTLFHLYRSVSGDGPKLASFCPRRDLLRVVCEADAEKYRPFCCAACLASLGCWRYRRREVAVGRIRQTELVVRQLRPFTSIVQFS
uniref:PLAC8 family protein n=1 Tax=Panagrellus redivivus TaxID=6233 RepID=A0A7E4UMS2_PANRE